MCRNETQPGSDEPKAGRRGTDPVCALNRTTAQVQSEILPGWPRDILEEVFQCCTVVHIPENDDDDDDDGLVTRGRRVTWGMSSQT